MACTSIRLNNVAGWLIGLLLIAPTFTTEAQSLNQYLASYSFSDLARGDQGLRIMSYNVENLFDYFDDSLKQDDEFLPFKNRYWTKERYEQKQRHIAQVIMAAGGWEAPALVGLCEIENRYVLESLTRFTELKSVGYEILHKDSPDIRGIDVALLYRRDKFQLLFFDYLEINFPFDQDSKTRDILYAKGKLANQDTLHIFLNHWPSKYGGEFETASKRAYVARQLKTKLDSLLKLNSTAKIVVMGDFNDEPDAESLQIITSDGDFKNLLSEVQYQYGTHSFDNKWAILDHFIVSHSLLIKSQKTHYRPASVKILNLDFLLAKGSLGNYRPFRSYQGPAYIGGYSDHLPIIMDILFR